MKCNSRYIARLETSTYHQEKCTVEEYINEFHNLIDLAGYMEEMAIVMKFRKGLQTDIQDQIMQLLYRCPDDNEPEEWYKVAVNCTENHHTNMIFHGQFCTATSAFSQVAFTPMAPKLVTSYVPAPKPLPVLVPMDIDTTCKKRDI
jgi:hypothetical protein